MELKPKRPPGRRDRKAAAYAAEICRLRAEGYTYETIREALADVGIELGLSALHREMRRLRGRTNNFLSKPKKHSWTSTGSASVVACATAPESSEQAISKGHEIAEAFFSAHLSNSLLQAKEIP